MAAKQKRKVSRREANRIRRQFEILQNMGFAPISDDNPFENTNVYQSNDNAQALVRKHKTLGDIKRQQTFKRRFGISSQSQYDALTTVLGSVMFQSLAEKTQLDSNQVIEAFKSFGNEVSAEQFEQAEATFETALSGREISFVDETAYNEALEAGFTEEEALEYAQLVGTESMDFSRETVMSDIRRILRSNQLLVNSQQRTNFMNPSQ